MYRVLVIALILLLGCSTNILIPPRENGENDNGKEEMATETLRPNATGDLTQNIPEGAATNWECVDEATPDEFTTKVVSPDESDGTDLYNIPNPSLSGEISKVTVYIRACYSVDEPPGLDRWAKTAIKTHGSVYKGSAETLALDSFVTFSTEYTTNPNTASAWTWDEIIALQIGVELQASYYPHWPDSWYVYCTQVYVIVTYTPYIDIGIRIRKSGETIKIGAHTLEASDKLRIRKGGTTYGIPLIDASASPFRILDGTALSNIVLEGGVNHNCSIVGNVKSGSCADTYDENPNNAYEVWNYHEEENAWYEKIASILSEHTWDTGHYVHRAFLRCYMKYLCRSYAATGETWLTAQLFLKWDDTWHLIKEYTNYISHYYTYSGDVRKVFDDKTGWNNVKGIKGYVKVRIKSNWKQEPLIAMSRIEAFANIGEGVVKGVPVIS